MLDLAQQLHHVRETVPSCSTSFGVMSLAEEPAHWEVSMDPTLLFVIASAVGTYVPYRRRHRDRLCREAELPRYYYLEERD